MLRNVCSHTIEDAICPEGFCVNIIESSLGGEGNVNFILSAVAEHGGFRSANANAPNTAREAT